MLPVMTTDAVTQQAASWTADASTFGARLALIRQRMGWGNVKTAAHECGLPAESWRNWERDGMEPRRLVTIAMAIATRTGCDYLWLVHGPSRGGATSTHGYGTERVLARVGQADRLTTHRTKRQAESRHHLLRSVRQTRPISGMLNRPRTPTAL